MNTKAVTILGVLAVAGIAAAYFAVRSSTTTSEDAAPVASGAGSPVFPSLVADAGNVTRIVVQRAPMQFTITRSPDKPGDAWTVADKANYPAKPEAVRALLLGLSGLTLDEPKTSRADQYAKLGVDDPAPPPPDAADKAVPQSALVTLKDASGKDVASVILGNPKWSGQGVVGSGSPGVYIRKPGDPQTWLARGQVDLPREPIGWLETKFADIKRDRIKSVTITHTLPTGSDAVAVSRDKQADPFVVQGIPAGRELKDPGVGESVASMLTGLTFQDVAAASTLDARPAADTKPGPTVELRTFDGLIVTATATTKDGKQWWKLAASADDALVNALPPAAAAANPTSPTPPDDAPAQPSLPTPPATPATPATPASPAVGTKEAIQKEVADLNSQWTPYVFWPADWKVRSASTPLTEMLKEPTPATAQPPTDQPPTDEPRTK